MTYDLSTLINIIKLAARRELLPRFAKVERDIKADGSFVTNADLGCQGEIQAQLEDLYPNHLFLAEEMSAEQQAELINSNQST